MTERSPIGEDLLRWASERGSGSWAAFRDAAAYCIAARHMKAKPWMLASDLSALGHLDIDYERGLWSVSPPCLALSPGMGMCAYLAGWRTSFLKRRFDAAADDLDLFPFLVPQRNTAPAVYVKAANFDALQATAERLGAQLVINPSAQLADAVNVETPSKLASPPPVDGDLEHFSLDALDWERVHNRESDGLYRFEMHGRQAFRLRREGDWFITDRSQGQAILLRGRDDVLVWQRGTSDLRRPRTVRIPTSISLPIIAERALVSASGLLPKIEKGQRVYVNVSRETADRVSRNLHLQLGTAKPRQRRPK